MNTETIQLPSAYQQQDNVWFFGNQATILGVNFKGLHVSYDLAVFFKKEGDSSTYERRAYLIDELMIEREAPKPKEHFIPDNSDAFREFLTGKRISFRHAETGTAITDSVDLFAIGEQWNAYKSKNKPQ